MAFKAISSADTSIPAQNPALPDLKRTVQAFQNVAKLMDRLPKSDLSALEVLNQPGFSSSLNNVLAQIRAIKAQRDLDEELYGMKTEPSPAEMKLFANPAHDAKMVNELQKAVKQVLEPISIILTQVFILAVVMKSAQK